MAVVWHFALAHPAFSANTACPLPRNVSKEKIMQSEAMVSIPDMDEREYANTEVATFGLG